VEVELQDMEFEPCDVDFIIVAWNGKSFTVLGQSQQGHLRRDMAIYRGNAPDRAIAIRQAQVDEQRRRHEALPKCAGCGDRVLLFDKRQRKDECLTCMHVRIKKGP
jgi:ribosomal protein S27E